MSSHTCSIIVPFHLQDVKLPCMAFADFDLYTHGIVTCTYDDKACTTCLECAYQCSFFVLKNTNDKSPSILNIVVQ